MKQTKLLMMNGRDGGTTSTAALYKSLTGVALLLASGPLKIVSGCIKRGTYETVTNPWGDF